MRAASGRQSKDSIQASYTAVLYFVLPTEGGEGEGRGGRGGRGGGWRGRRGRGGEEEGEGEGEGEKEGEEDGEGEGEGEGKDGDDWGGLWKAGIAAANPTVYTFQCNMRTRLMTDLHCTKLHTIYTPMYMQHAIM